MIVSIEEIDNCLPQTQCTKCGYKDCYDYAKAITNGEKHNRCPPGGIEGIKRLSNLLHRSELPLDDSYGTEQPKKLAIINEDLCIGCMKCILACPVDAIVGAKKLMHTVIADECTGCDLCVEPCPMDCIDMIGLIDRKQPKQMSQQAVDAQRSHYQQRHKQKLTRLKTKEETAHKTHQQNIALAKQNIDKKAYIQQALASFKNKKNI